MVISTRFLRRAACALSASLLAACGSEAPAEAKGEIDFVRGCWASHDEPGGRVTALLRLLPDREAGTTLTGHLSVMHDDPKLSSVKSSAELTLARDGSNFVIAPAGGTARMLQRTQTPYTAVEALTEGEQVAAFTADAERDGWMVILGAEEALTIYAILPDYSDGETLFSGGRDGCD